MKQGRLYTMLRVLRVNQWIKNLVVFTAVTFSGQLFDIALLSRIIYAFLTFCLLSSTSYVLNDIIDYPFDKKHPIKRFRPIASGEVTIPEATFIVFLLTLISLIISLIFSIQFFLLSLVFILLHFFYSLYLKKYPIIDIFTISVSFMLRAFGGEVVSGYHIPIWLLLTIFFGSLFMATVKRHAELVSHGKEARLSLFRYKEHLLDFLTNTFATTTIIAYSFYTYFEKLPTTKTIFTDFFAGIFPEFEARKWLMVTIPLVVYGIARYAQLLYEREEGERPEKIITNDTPLIVTIGLWGFIIVSLIYIL
ncbi:hypothetical protein COT62_01535 [Candidatus Roizmanbacteria bacterium CG09_land_8_20_14_0_10_41_9]|uniref:Decaprenyl-phosphate phosphoribosyltransferase n=1 Tax=Candidatus Roizmanbacteria bacterium CG09_land_8_20_14_0_10_41_9 TaxID=1974850 RepID=A0A2H0WVB4_9BACT|nr:MAG: hypothetical protein COT62_01535 [Candidatus Roizmanbacteria bacterium CG09_land_8_20_14_0_10_41_9]